MTRGQHTYAEILSQPQVWSDVLQIVFAHQERIAAALRDVNPKQVLFTGCGSTYYLSLSAAAMLQQSTGLPCRGVPASEIVFFPNTTIAQPQETLLIAVSRSGTTTETGAAMARFREKGGKTIWGVTCYPDTSVADETDFVLMTEAAQEESVAQTRSFSSMLLMTQAIAAVAGGEELAPLKQLPSAVAELLEKYGAMAERLGGSQDLQKFFFLGSGPLYGIACEAMLKMKEMSISYSEAFHFMEFRHGPKSMVDEHALLIGLFNSRIHAYEEAVLTECGDMGGYTLAQIAGDLHPTARERIALPAGLPWWAMPALNLPVLQLMAYHRSISKGLDPDSPRNLTAVVELDRGELVAAPLQ